MEIIAVYNIKGGVGKTTTVVNLAYLSAAAGWRTLLWDLDPQGAASYLLRCAPPIRGSSRKLVRGRREASELIQATGYDKLNMLPADLSYRQMDVHLSERKKPTARLLKLIRPLSSRYASLFLDCPPGMSLVSENVMRAADAIVVPMLPSPLSIRMLEQLLEFRERENWQDLILLPFFSMVDHRKALHKQVIADVRARFPMVLRTEIPYWSDIERMSLRRAPLPAFAPGNSATALYRALWSEIDGRMNRHWQRSAVPEAAAAQPLPVAADGQTPALVPER